LPFGSLALVPALASDRDRETQTGNRLGIHLRATRKRVFDCSLSPPLCGDRRICTGRVRPASGWHAARSPAFGHARTSTATLEFPSPRRAIRPRAKIVALPSVGLRNLLPSSNPTDSGDHRRYIVHTPTERHPFHVIVNNEFYKNEFYKQHIWNPELTSTPAIIVR
jgi:hypothetical protein